MRACVWEGGRGCHVCLFGSVVAVLVLFVLFDYWLGRLTGFGYGCRLFRVVAGGVLETMMLLLLQLLLYSNNLAQSALF